MQGRRCGDITSHKVPEWLSNDERYTPLPDKDTFINKTILALIGLISRIRVQGNVRLEDCRVNPSLRLVLTLFLVILISLSQSLAFVIAVNVYLIACLSLMNARDISGILRVSLAMSAFTFAAMLPAVFLISSLSGAMTVSKVFATVTAVGILSRSARWSFITASLRFLRVPDIFVLVLDIAIRYIYMLGDFALEMMYSLKLRSVGNNSSKHSAISGIAGTMFIRSKEMAEEMCGAMECRGFTGEYRPRNASGYRLGIRDFVFVALNAAMAALFIYLERA